MKATQVFLPIALTLGLLACTEKSEFQGESKPEETVTKVEDAELPPLDTGADSKDAMSAPKASDADSGDSSSMPAGAITDQHAVSLKVDMVFAIDTSASMDDEINALQTNMGRLISALNTGRIDFQIHMMMDLMMALPPGVDPKKVAFINQEVGSGNSISQLNALFAGTYAASYRTPSGVVMPTPLAFRKDANLEVVVVSDDNGDGNGNLAADFNPMNAKATFSAIVGLPTTIEGGNCDISGIGMEYIALAQASRGSMLDICSPDWSGLITRLSKDMVQRSVTFALSQKPSDPKGIGVMLDQAKLAAADWVYNPDTNTVTLVNSDKVKDGSKVRLTYKPTAG
ncbi:MAG TPA: hypothetical protein VFO10_22305 [Oligoflexus sp.]|uniref:hypothetical protein n=1 Tax=Oligoflexus sp. TaxID=1971216 RepID=UPI002D7F3191|nr:hypothetical protein [Oligoflexus sp.]HET9240011.1 hypothetical protein [Oligoflexus sp.]